MYLKFDDGFCDFDLDLLRVILTLLDSPLDDLQRRIKLCHDPVSSGLCDQAEYLVGTGFIVCQRYLSSTYGCNGVAKEHALSIGPYHKGGKTLASLLNAAANYWKHESEWPIATFEEAAGEKTMVAVSMHDTNALTDHARKTILAIETATSWSNYTCANLLFELTGPDFRLTSLIPILEDWRQQLDSTRIGQ